MTFPKELYFKLSAYRQHTVFKNFFYLLINHVVSQLLMFAAYSILARKISVPAFGTFGFAQAYYNYFLIVLNLGLPLYAIKKYPSLKSDQARLELINLTITIKFFLFLLLILPYIFLAYYLGKDAVTIKVILLLGIGLFVMVFNMEWYFRAIQKMHFIAIANVSKSFLFLFGVMFIIRGDESILALALIFVAAFLALVIIYLVISGMPGKIRIIPKFDKIWPIVRESVILGLSIILIQVYYSFGTLTLGVFRNNTEVGYYSTVYKLLMFFLAIVSLYLKAAFPHMATISENRENLYRFIVKLTRMASIMSLLVVAIVLYFAQEIVVLAFSQKYLPSVGAFRILILTFWVLASRTLIENSLIITDQSTKYLLTVFIGAFTNIVINLIFVPDYGIYAAASATLVSELVFSFVAFYFSRLSFAQLFGYT